MTRNYIKLENGKIYLHKDFVNEINSVERLVFDCDGVLINTKNSYRKAIRGTLSLFFRPFFQRDVIRYRDIEKLKFTGIYNNDWDTTYALALFLFTTLPKEIAKDLIQWLTGQVLESKFKRCKSSFDIEFENFLNKIKSDPINDPEEYATKVCQDKGTFNELQKFVNIIGRPNNVRESLLAKVFDSLYYGEELFEKIYNINPPIKIKRGYIEKESLYISKRTLVLLKEIFNSKMYLLTGRSKISVQYKINDIEEYFDMKRSYFIEDIVRDGIGDINLFKKPSPTPLLKLADNQPTLYVGDSAEDLIMAKKAKESSNKIYFAGIAKLDDEAIRKYFMESNADLIISSVNKLPKVFKNKMSEHSL
ncbi:MAG: HAD family hydrolase [Nitrososphaeria archaeon]